MRAYVSPYISISLSFLCLLFVGCGQSRETTMMPDQPNFGAACGDALPCAGGLSCLAGDLFPQGYCTSTCDASACPDGATCTSDFGTAICLGNCESDTDCRDSYQCFHGSCRPDCVGDIDCGAGSICGDGGVCLDPECTSNEQCADGLVCVSGGTCEDGTIVHGEGEACGGTTQLCSVGLVCLMAAEGGTCAKACDNNASCDSFDLVCSAIPVDRDGDGAADVVDTACLPITVSGAFVGGACSTDADCDARLCINNECVVPCHDETDCLGGQSCIMRQRPSVPGTFFGCGFNPIAGSGVEYLDIPLGTESVPAGLLGPEVHFAVPDDAVSVTLMARPATESTHSISFFEVKDPARASVFNLTEIYDYVDQPIRWLPDNNGGMASMMIPNSTPDRITLGHGRYTAQLTLFSDASDSLDVEVFARVKRAPGGNITSGTLDLNIFLVTPDLSASTAGSNGRLQDAIEVLRTIYSPVGITIGTINYVDVTASQRATYSVIDSADSAGSELDQMFELSAGQTNNALNLFLVDRIDAASGRETGVILGIAGGIPGAGNIHGTNHSGVAVSFSTDLLGGGFHSSELIAQIMGHEMGHYLGLFHNSEEGRACAVGEAPTMADPCAPFAGGDVLSDTTHADMTNLMFWSEMGNFSLSAGQGYVMLRNMLIH